MACNEHGARDPNVPEFVCVICDPLLLVASATGSDEADQDHSGDDNDNGGNGGGPSGGSGGGGRRVVSAALRFTDVDDFLTRRPYGEEWVREEMDRLRESQAGRAAAALVNGDEVRTDLLLAAMAITRLLRIPSWHQDPQVRNMLPEVMGEPG